MATMRPLHHGSRQANPLQIEQDLLAGLSPGGNKDKYHRRRGNFQQPNDARRWIVGCDESGTGALAGPMVAAAVCCLDPSDATTTLPRVRDGKVLTATERTALVEALDAAPQQYLYSVAVTSPAEIDAAPSIQAAVDATMRAALMDLQSKLQALSSSPQDEWTHDSMLALVDGKRAPPKLPMASRPWIQGDATVYSIALASVVARVVRDDLVGTTAAVDYPQHGFAAHGGYPSAAHREILDALGPTPYHRRSCRVVRERDALSSS
jgi:ribonuclease HII